MGQTGDADVSELGAFVQERLGTQMGATSSCAFCKVPFKEMVLSSESRGEVKVLACLHLACGRCLQGILRKGQEALCPICDAQIKEQNYSKFLCHFAENQRLDFRAVSDTTSIAICCDECVEAGPAVQYCAQCVRRLCLECSEHHRRSKASASHALTTLKEQQEHSLHRAATCSGHPHMELEFFCEDCDVMCCRNCIQEEHETHVYKLPSSGLLEKQRKALQAHLQQLRQLGSSLQERHQQVTTSIQDFEDEMRSSVQDIRNLEARVKEALQQRRQEMLQEVDGFRARQRESYEARRSSLACTMLTRWRAIDFLEKVLARGTNCEVLLLTGYISAQQLLGDDVLASKVAELALANAFRKREAQPVSWSGDVAAASSEISKMTAVVSSLVNKKTVDDGPTAEAEVEKVLDDPEREEASQTTHVKEDAKAPERVRGDKPAALPGRDAHKISLADAVGQEPRRAISLFDALQPTNATKLLIKRLGGATVQTYSDKEMQEHGLGELRAVLGLEGDELGCFRSPCGMAIDSTRLFVADTMNSRIQVFSKSSLQPMGVVSFREGSEVQKLEDPSGLCCIESDGSTTLIVVEYRRDRILKMHMGPALTALSVQELAPGTLYGPFGAGFSLGRIVVADSCNHRCLVLTLSGQVLLEFGGRGSAPGQFEYPECIATFSGGHIAVSDKDNHRIQVFDNHGKFHHFIPKDWAPSRYDPGKPGCLSGPMGMCVDHQDRLFVADCGSDRVQIFSREGAFLWSSCGESVSARFKSPTAMAADDQGLVYVASDHCVQVF